MAARVKRVWERRRSVAASIAVAIYRCGKKEASRVIGQQAFVRSFMRKSSMPPLIGGVRERWKLLAIITSGEGKKKKKKKERNRAGTQSEFIHLALAYACQRDFRNAFQRSFDERKDSSLSTLFLFCYEKDTFIAHLCLILLYIFKLPRKKKKKKKLKNNSECKGLKVPFESNIIIK